MFWDYCDEVGIGRSGIFGIVFLIMFLFGKRLMEFGFCLGFCVKIVVFRVMESDMFSRCFIM